MISGQTEIVLAVEGLSKSYGDLLAVNDLSFEIKRGEIFGFLGPNGAGKTTTISMICGLLKADSGEVYFDELPLTKNFGPGQRKMGLCPQELVIWESLTCLEQLIFVARSYDIGRKIARKEAEELLGVLGLDNKKNKLAKTLSGGMKRRLNIALALVHDPQLLILDEPQAGLDPQSRILVRDYIRSLSKKCTVLLTTHDMDEADRLADRIAIIDNGRLLVLDTSENLKKGLGEGELLEVTIVPKTLGSWDMFQKKIPQNLSGVRYSHGTFQAVGRAMINLLPELMELLKQNQVEVLDITIRKKTLEDVFISLTGRRLRE